MRNAKTEAKAEAADGDAASANEAAIIIKGSYWYRKFYIEERDAKRSNISREELYKTVFSAKFWFKAKSYPDGVLSRKERGVFPSGIDGHSLSDDLRFLPNGKVTGLPEKYSKGDFYDVNSMGTIVNLGMSLEHGTHPIVSLYVHRRKDWGWELRSNLHVIRSKEEEDESTNPTAATACSNIVELWKDYVECLVVEKRRKGVATTRLRYKYSRREVPDILEIKEFLLW